MKFKSKDDWRQLHANKLDKHGVAVRTQRLGDPAYVNLGQPVYLYNHNARASLLGAGRTVAPRVAAHKLARQRNQEEIVRQYLASKAR